MIIKRWVSKIINKLLRKWRKHFLLRTLESRNANLGKMTSTQKRAVDVVFELLKDEENELLIAPLSNKYYLKNDKINMLVTLFAYRDNGGFVNIINGKFHYDIWLDTFSFNYMLDRFKRIIDRRRNTMELEIRAKVDKSLETIYQNLKEEHELKINKD